LQKNNRSQSLSNSKEGKNLIIRLMLLNSILNISFRRALNHNKSERWIHRLQRLISVSLTKGQDQFQWGLTSSGSSSVKSIYLDLLNGHTPFLGKHIWKMKVPLKIKILTWFLHRKVLLTEGNLAKRAWSGSKKCCFCDQDESNSASFYFMSSCEDHLAYYAYLF
jgi:hypothetical protein